MKALLSEENFKKCKNCKEVKNLSMFRKEKAMKNGYRNQCNTCVNLRILNASKKKLNKLSEQEREVKRIAQNEYNRKWHAENADKKREMYKARAKRANDNRIRKLIEKGIYEKWKKERRKDAEYYRSLPGAVEKAVLRKKLKELRKLQDEVSAIFGDDILLDAFIDVEERIKYAIKSDWSANFTADGKYLGEE